MKDLEAQMLQNHIRLDDLLARQVGARWFEGVAVVQSVCRQLLAPGAGTAGFPTASDILLGPEGSVAILGKSGADAVPTAAHLLARMLSDDVPVRLRLAVTQATGTDSGYASLMEFSDALTYFERPNPEAIIRAFRERAMLAPLREDAAQHAPAHAPLDVKPVVPPQGSKPGHVTTWAVVVAIVAAVVCAAVWLVRVGGGDPRLTAALSSLKQSVGTVFPTPAAPAVEKGTTGSAAPKPSKAAGRSQAHAARPERALPRADAQAAWVAPRSQPLYYPALSLLVSPVDIPETTDPMIVVFASAVRDAQGIEQNPGRIYSKEDGEVTLPRNVYPKFPDVPPGLDLRDRTILELVIATDGLVERVKLLTPPHDVHEFMLLSAAKSWMFDPARVEGRPVRFRHTMAIFALP